MAHIMNRERKMNRISKYINADELKVFMRTILTGNDLYTPNGIDEFVDRLPAADVVEVLHGRWEWDGEYFCSVCGYREPHRKPLFCGGCGAKMDEVEK